MITLAEYLMGRDLKFACSTEVLQNASQVVTRTNELKELYGGLDEGVASGWRPSAVNDATCNAAKTSTHITGQALDTRDTHRVFAKWCLQNLDKLEAIGLWMEDPRWTPTWVHLQTVPPKSGKRVYIPSTKPPLAPPL